MMRMTALLAIVMLALGACSSGEGDRHGSPDDAVFGDGKFDPTQVLATVDGYDITQRMLDLRLEALGKEGRARYGSAEGQRLLLRDMVDQYLRVREAERRGLEDDPQVMRSLIMHRRETLDDAVRNELIKGQEPTPEQIRAYFENHRDQYQRLGTMRVSHIETRTREKAEEAYEKARDGDKPFPYVVAEYSINEESKKNQGELGYFNEGGYLPMVPSGKEFTEKVWDLEDGLNPPIKVGDHWHVVYVHGREWGRPQTLDEAYNRVLNDMRPEFEREILDSWEDQARAEADVEYFGDFRPGKGKTPEQLFERARSVKDPQHQIDLFTLLAEDYPDSEQADDALFLAANVYLDRWGDRPAAARYLRRLLRDHPDSPYAEDAQYILENLDRPNFTNPKSIEDLRQ